MADCGVFNVSLMRVAGSVCPEGVAMLDLLYLGIAVLFFWLMALMTTRGLDHR